MAQQRKPPEVIRVRIPKHGEILGIVLATLGAGRMEVRCSDGKTRICRIPGKMRRRIYMRVGDLVIITPWVVQSDERGDIDRIYHLLL